jgi:hypothetical protein
MLRRALLAAIVAVLAAGCGGTSPGPSPAGLSAGKAQQAPPGPASKPPMPGVLPKEKEPGPPLPPIAYDPRGRRDPFSPITLTKEEKRPVSLGPVKLVGIVRGRAQLLALVETPDGLGYILKVGDVLGDGQVAEIAPRAVTFVVAARGGQRPATLTLRLATD